MVCLICSGFLAYFAASNSWFHSTFYPADEENSAPSQVDAIPSASFQFEEKVVNIFNSLHTMEKKQNKETEQKFQKLTCQSNQRIMNVKIYMSKEMKQVKNIQLINNLLTIKSWTKWRDGYK